MQRILPLTRQTFVDCSEGCDKPGVGSPNHDPYDQDCSDLAVCCCPCAFTIDIITLPFRPIIWIWKWIRRHSKRSV